MIARIGKHDVELSPHPLDAGILVGEIDGFRLRRCGPVRRSTQPRRPRHARAIWRALLSALVRRRAWPEYTWVSPGDHLDARRWRGVCTCPNCARPR